jgi:hypothetical protein
MQRLFLMMAPVALAGCVTSPAPSPEQSKVASIAFETAPCFGFCPQFGIDVSAGQGIYDGKSSVLKQGTHSFTVSPAEFAAFRDRLAPFRPEQSVAWGRDNCEGPVRTDSPSVKITWRDQTGESVTLDWYMGCRQPGLAEQSDEIYEAWQELPLAALVGDDAERSTYSGLE